MLNEKHTHDRPPCTDYIEGEISMKLNALGTLSKSIKTFTNRKIYSLMEYAGNKKTISMNLSQE